MKKKKKKKRRRRKKECTELLNSLPSCHWKCDDDQIRTTYKSTSIRACYARAMRAQKSPQALNYHHCPFLNENTHPIRPAANPQRTASRNRVKTESKPSWNRVETELKPSRDCLREAPLEASCICAPWMNNTWASWNECRKRSRTAPKLLCKCAEIALRAWGCNWCQTQLQSPWNCSESHQHCHIIYSAPNPVKSITPTQIKQ